MNTPTPRYILTCGALIQATDGLGNPAGDWVKYSDYERDLAAREEELARARRDLAIANERLETMTVGFRGATERAERAEAMAEQCRTDTEIAERHQAKAEAELATTRSALEQAVSNCERDYGDKVKAEAERDAAVFAINNHNKDCKASCEEQRSRNSCGFASYYPKKNCPNCPEDWAIDAIGRKP